MIYKLSSKSLILMAHRMIMIIYDFFSFIILLIKSIESTFKYILYTLFLLYQFFSIQDFPFSNENIRLFISFSHLLILIFIIQLIHTNIKLKIIDDSIYF